jgi:hypothetical protein
VWEWTADWYGAYGPDDVTSPKGPHSGKERVVRGGAWNGAYPDWLRPTFRFKSSPETRSHGNWLPLRKGRADRHFQRALALNRALSTETSEKALFAITVLIDSS